ncbi:hypothetical protein DB43_FS00450 [Parachlamydia acanthamoebae]|nr:hypothetical protein DB43_FS00450 [Parachlamydia acanthamoebae]
MIESSKNTFPDKVEGSNFYCGTINEKAHKMNNKYFFSIDKVNERKLLPQTERVGALNLPYGKLCVVDGKAETFIISNNVGRIYHCVKFSKNKGFFRS